MKRNVDIHNFAITQSDLAVGGVIKYSNALYKEIFSKNSNVNNIYEYYFYDSKVMKIHEKNENSFSNVKRTRLFDGQFKKESKNGETFASPLSHWRLVLNELKNIKNSIVIINITFTNFVSKYSLSDINISYEELLAAFENNEIILVDHGVGNNKYDFEPTIKNKNILQWNELFEKCTLISYTSDEVQILKDNFFDFKDFLDIPLYSDDTNVNIKKFEDKEYDFVYLGRYSSVKEIPKIIKFAETNKFKILFIGQGNKEIEEALEISEYCTNVGVKLGDEKFEYLSKAKFSINFSRAEGFSFSLIEGMKVGNPVVINAGKFLASNFIADNGGGISSNNENEILEYFNANNNPDSYSKIQKMAIKKYSNFFTKDIFKKKWSNLISSKIDLINKSNKKIIHIYGWFASNIGDDLLFHAFINNTNYDEYRFINSQALFGASYPAQQSYLTIKHYYSNGEKNITFSNKNPDQNINTILNMRRKGLIADNVKYHFANVGGSLWGEKLIKSKYERSELLIEAYDKTFSIGSNFSVFNKKTSKKYLSKIIDNYTKFVVRDTWSKNSFSNKENLYLEADPVYSLYGKFKKGTKNNYLVISLTRPEESFNQQFNKDYYFDKIWEQVQFLINEKNIEKIYFMSFNNNRDIPLSVDFVNQFGISDISEIVHYEGDVDKFMDYYKFAKYSIATRFHSIIISNIMEVETWAWSYDNKNENHLFDLGLKPMRWYKIDKIILDKNKISAIEALKHYEN